MRTLDLSGLRWAAAGAAIVCCAAVTLGGDIVSLDLSADAARQVVVDREPGQYLGHPTTVLLEDGATVLCVYPRGHGRGAISLKRSTDGGRTWSARLPVPENWATSQETPTIHRVIDADGRRRLIVFSGLHPVRMAVSEDDGATWSDLEPVGDWGGIVVMGAVVPLRSGPDGGHAGDYLGFFHDDGRFIALGAKAESPVRFTLYSTRSTDGGLHWSRPRPIWSSTDVHLCEPGVIRSPDGKRLAMLLRENARRKNSHVMFSDDEGQTWTEPRELPRPLTGDRHVGVYGRDGRLFVSFRDTATESPTAGDWVAWVGTWNDIEQGRDGEYRVRLMDNTRARDCGYPGVEVLPDGTILATSYGHWVKGEPPFVVAVRLTLDELDHLAAAGRAVDRVAVDPPAKLPPRPERTPRERSEEVTRLRGVYGGDPAAWPAPHVDPGVAWKELGLLPAVAHPEGNPPNAAKTQLGRLLFFDRRLSASGHLACATCHDPRAAWAAGQELQVPEGTTARNSPTIRNTAFHERLFWDGRAGSLEEQVRDSIGNPAEMAAVPERVVDLLVATPVYRDLFAEAFGGRAIDFDGVIDAIASFQRTVVGGRSRFDAYLRGDVALSDEELLGLDLFRRDARCMNCHHGPTFSDGGFHDLGLSFYGRSIEDLGRYRVTGVAADVGRFRTPGLRDATKTGSLMHSGRFDLAGVLAMYNAGMPVIKRHAHQRDDPLFPTKSPHLRPLGLNRQDLADLAAFLAALEEPAWKGRLPRPPDDEPRP